MAWATICSGLANTTACSLQHALDSALDVFHSQTCMLGAEQDATQPKLYIVDAHNVGELIGVNHDQVKK
jgi:hypothetical protein